MPDTTPSPYRPRQFDGCYCDQGDFTDDEPCAACRETEHERFLEDTHD